MKKARNRQISVRPSPEFLSDIELIGEEFNLSDAEVLRQLLAVGLQSFKDGKVTIARAKNDMSTRTTAKKISRSISGRVVNVGAYKEPPALNIPLPKGVISSE